MSTDIFSSTAFVLLRHERETFFNSSITSSSFQLIPKRKSKKVLWRYLYLHRLLFVICNWRTHICKSMVQYVNLCKNSIARVLHGFVPQKHQDLLEQKGKHPCIIVSSFCSSTISLVKMKNYKNHQDSFSLKNAIPIYFPACQQQNTNMQAKQRMIKVR